MKDNTHYELRPREDGAADFDLYGDGEFIRAANDAEVYFWHCMIEAGYCTQFDKEGR